MLFVVILPSGMCGNKAADTTFAEFFLPEWACPTTHPAIPSSPQSATEGAVHSPDLGKRGLHPAPARLPPSPASPAAKSESPFGFSDVLPFAVF